MHTVASGGTQVVSGTVTTRSGLPGQPFGVVWNPSVTVPSGRHLVVETLNLSAGVSAGHRVIAWVDYTCGGNHVGIFVPLTYMNTNTDDYYGATTEVHLYADPGTTVSIGTFSADGTVSFTRRLLCRAIWSDKVAGPIGDSCHGFSPVAASSSTPRSRGGRPLKGGAGLSAWPRIPARHVGLGLAGEHGGDYETTFRYAARWQSQLCR